MLIPYSLLLPSCHIPARSYCIWGRYLSVYARPTGIVSANHQLDSSDPG